ncbi:LysR family transcriptional regulator substrate-binding protein [Desulfosarcina ovata]|uniref:LysR substrate-binding domain-containing protein n=2 Tax=Desulfosarcina ovata TaxID=83564 RepID=A0A5K8AG80_9BACT|nr:LysR family transcriptional regulator substrate-binding protein [Desulfosarcina ovata]BBO84347.1 hypothetical protein DSCO28_49130 [Desulfosarcina ovata subsp. sediminis]BBO90860.1 hypothetical protein DSCOOX_40400 [Desulfosarcina ovata subsp. ovata]
MTETGQKLFHYAEQFYLSAIKAETFLQEQKNNNLSIGIASPLTQQFIVLIKKFKQYYPHVMVTLREGTDQEIIADVRDFKLMLGFIGTIEQSVRELNVIPVAPENRLVLVSFPQNPLACKEKVIWKDLEGCSLIIHREGMTGRNIILDAFKKNRIKPVITAEIESIEGMKNLIKQDAGIGLKFFPNVKEEILNKTLKIIPLESDQLKIGIDAVFQANISLSLPSKAFLDIAIEHFNNISTKVSAGSVK